MPALKQLGLVILAAFVVSLGALGYTYMQKLTAESEARDAALAVHNRVLTVITTGSPQTVSVKIPSGYVMRFEENQVLVVTVGDNRVNLALPEQGYSLSFADNCPELVGGSHELAISLEDNKVVIARI